MQFWQFLLETMSVSNMKRRRGEKKYERMKPTSTKKYSNDSPSSLTISSCARPPARSPATQPLRHRDSGPQMNNVQALKIMQAHRCICALWLIDSRHSAPFAIVTTAIVIIIVTVVSSGISYKENGKCSNKLSFQIAEMMI